MVARSRSPNHPPSVLNPSCTNLASPITILCRRSSSSTVRSRRPASAVAQAQRAFDLAARVLLRSQRTPCCRRREEAAQRGGRFRGGPVRRSAELPHRAASARSGRARESGAPSGRTAACPEDCSGLGGVARSVRSRERTAAPDPPPERPSLCRHPADPAARPSAIRRGTRPDGCTFRWTCRAPCGRSPLARLAEQCPQHGEMNALPFHGELELVREAFLVRVVRSEHAPVARGVGMMAVGDGRQA